MMRDTTTLGSVLLARAAHDSAISLREAAIKMGYVTAEEFDALVKPEDMTHP